MRSSTPFLKVNLFARVGSIQEEFPELLLSTGSRVNINNGDAKRMARGAPAEVYIQMQHVFAEYPYSK